MSFNCTIVRSSTHIRTAFVDGLRTRAGDVLTHCSSRLKLACHSALNKLLFNYSREAEVPPPPPPPPPPPAAAAPCMAANNPPVHNDEWLDQCMYVHISSLQVTSALSEALPCLSSAVSTIITTSENEDFKANCYKLLKASPRVIAQSCNHIHNGIHYAHVPFTHSEQTFSCVLLLQVEDSNTGGQDGLSACILQSLQKLAQMSVTFAKATPPQAKRDVVSSSM